MIYGLEPMGKDLAIIYYVLAAVGFLASCNTAYYSPNMQHVPMLDSKGDAEVIGSITGSPFIPSHIGINGAYAISDDLIVTGNYTGTLGIANYVELGGGYNYRENRLFAQLLGGIGYGHGKREWEEGTGGMLGGPREDILIESSGMRYSFMPTVGLEMEYFALAFSTRLAYVNYFNITESSSDPKSDFPFQIGDNPNQLFLEPAATLRFKYKSVGLQFQLVGASNLTDRGFLYEQFTFSTGLIFDINK